MANKLALTDCINPNVVESAGELFEAFTTARPFRHVVIDHFLSEAFCRDVCEQFPAFVDSHAINENRQVGGKATRENVSDLGSAFKRMDGLARHPQFLSLI